MNLHILKSTTLFFMILVVISACKKDEIPESYMRGANNLAIGYNNDVVVAGYNYFSSKSYDAVLILSDLQKGDSTWSRNFGGAYADAFYAVKKSNTGGFIATGFSNKVSTGSPQMFVVITKEDGSLEKSLKFGGSGFSQGFNLLPLADPDSGYIISGYIQKSSTTDRDIYLVRINDSGDTLWTSTIQGQSSDSSDALNDAAYNIIAAPDGGFFLTGSLNGYNSEGGNIFLMKITNKGKKLWSRTYNSGIGFSLTLTSDGGVAIAGTIQEGSNQDVVLIKTDTAGTLIWRETFGGSAGEFAASMIETSDKGFAITGITNSKGHGSEDIYLILTDNAGKNPKEYTYGGSDVDQGYGIVQLPSDDICISGLSNSDGSFIYLNRVNKTDGSEIWIKKFR